jgi:Flp pilus assembly pilin Flp
MNIRAIQKTARRLVSDNRGAAVTEYVIIVALIAMIALGVYRTFGQAISAKVTTQTGQINGL